MRGPSSRRPGCRGFSRAQGLACKADARPSAKRLPIRFTVGAARHRSEACEHFTAGDGFWEIVVRTKLESHNPICFLASVGEHEYGDLAFLAYPFEDFEPVHPREHHVEEDGMPMLFVNQGKSLRAGVGIGHGVAQGFEIARNESTKFAIIVNQKHRVVVGIRWVGRLHGLKKTLRFS